MNDPVGGWGNGWGDVLARLRANRNSQMLLLRLETGITPLTSNMW